MSLTDIDPYDPELNQLHDAVLKDIAVDCAARTVTIGIDFYRAKKAPERHAGVITFEEVESVSQVANLVALGAFASAGNITQWELPEGNAATTYISGAGTSIAINAKRFRLSIKS